MSATRAVVLAVDDDTDLLGLLAKVLGAQYQVLTASDPGTALELAGGEPRPDLILLDVDMPGATGFELIALLKEDGKTAHIPVVFLTGRTDPQDQTEGFQLGAADYITKPINAAVLRARVRIQLALANRNAELERQVAERTAQLESTRAQLIRRLARAMEKRGFAPVTYAMAGVWTSYRGGRDADTPEVPTAVSADSMTASAPSLASMQTMLNGVDQGELTLTVDTSGNEGLVQSREGRTAETAGAARPCSQTTFCPAGIRGGACRIIAQPTAGIPRRSAASGPSRTPYRR